jgi:hypothetical protein
VTHACSATHAADREPLAREPGASRPAPVGIGLCAALVALSLASLAAAEAHAPADYAAELISASRRLGLSDDPTWHALLHYRSRPLGGVESVAQSPEFFLAEDGRTNPQAELEATLASFFDPQLRLRESQPARCVFVARHAWLAERLGFDGARMPEVSCTDYESWRASVGPTRGVTLIFPEAYMNNPSSMFGHTLLRLDAVPSDSDEERSDLLAYAVNFAAFTGADGGVLFAVRGVIGSYSGFFSMAPYYEKVKLYSDWESRDLWEYPLDLEQPGIERLVQHLWELDEVAFPYYFFSENCSYELLGLLEVARPGVGLRDRTRGWVIPVDTVRLARVDFGTGDGRYRPSASTRLRHLATGIAPENVRLARELVDGRAELDDPRLVQLPDESRAAVLTLAHDYARHTAEKEEDPERKRRTLAMLIARSRIPTVGDPGPRLTAPAVRPDEGHGTARLQIGGGWRDEDFYTEIRLRPAFHDLLDPVGGYTDGAQINFLDVAVRYYTDDSDLELHELTVVDIVSLSPRDELFRPISWKFRTGLTDPLIRRSGGKRELRRSHVWHTQGGAGVTLEPAPGVYAYATLESAFDVGSDLDSDYAWGAGIGAGVLLSDALDRYRLHLRAQALGYFAGATRPAYTLELSQRLRLTRRTAVELQLGMDRDFHEGWLSAGLFWKLYF